VLDEVAGEPSPPRPPLDHTGVFRRRPDIAELIRRDRDDALERSTPALRRLEAHRCRTIAAIDGPALARV